MHRSMKSAFLHCMPSVCRSAYDAVYVRARVAERRASTLLTYFKSAYLPACSEITLPVCSEITTMYVYIHIYI